MLLNFAVRNTFFKQNLQDNNLSLYEILLSQFQLASISISLRTANLDTSVLPDDPR